MEVLKDPSSDDIAIQSAEAMIKKRDVVNINSKFIVDLKNFCEIN